MPIVTDPQRTRELLDELRERRVALPCFCTENSWTTETILKAARTAGRRFGLADPPVSIAFTGGYPARQNLGNYWECSDQQMGFDGLMSDLRTLMDERGPYAHCLVYPMLDHGQPDEDRWLLEDRLEEFAMVMFDASHSPLEENIRRTARYVEAHSDRVVIEGAVAELKEAREEVTAPAMTTPEQAKRFLDETGCDLIVPNVGTEHRAAEAGHAHYDGGRAREISDLAGRKLVLHGTSCMGQADLSAVPGDGFVKVNVWTIIEKTGARKMVEYVLRNVGHLVERDEVDELIEEGLLGERLSNPEFIDEQFEGDIGPHLDYFPIVELRERWVQEVAETLGRYSVMFGYERLGD